MNNKKYKLTISLLASNRKDTLPKTLASLKPILDNVSSELIVVDTGCDEDLLEVVRQYTDKIYKFEWCKDFSKARNVGIDNAQGDWFMFIDDDEWFEDVTEFIEFFNSDEMNKYNYGKYVVRNYENMEGTVWTDSIAGRMFRLLDGTRFKDAVHERPVNIAGPTKSFSSYAHHYGYVYKTEEDRRAHIKRNTDLLLEQIKKEPTCARHYCHLTQEYNVIKEYEKSLEYALEGIKKVDMSVGENKKDLSGLYGNVVWVMVNQLRYEDVIIQSNEYLASPHITELGKLALYGFMATAAYKLGKYQECIDYTDKFFEFCDMFKKNSDLIYQQDAILIMMSASPENEDRIRGVAFTAAVLCGDVERMVQYIEPMSSVSVIDVELCMKNIAIQMKTAENVNVYRIILNKIITNNGYFNLLLTHIEKMKDEDMNGFLNVADIMSGVDTNHAYVQFMNIISKRNEDISILETLYARAINDISDLINLHHHFWNIAAQRGINLATMVALKPMNQWMSSIDKWATDVKVKELFEKKQDLSAVLDTESMHMKYFDMIFVEALLYRKKLDDITLEEIKKEMINYTNVVMAFYRNIYKDSVFLECPTILPNRCQAALGFMKVLCGDSTDVAKDMHAVESLLPGVKSLVDKYIELM